jgi:hypothetical protein
MWRTSSAAQARDHIDRDALCSEMSTASWSPGHLAAATLRRLQKRDLMPPSPVLCWVVPGPGGLGDRRQVAVSPSPTGQGYLEPLERRPCGHRDVLKPPVAADRADHPLDLVWEAVTLGHADGLVERRPRGYDPGLIPHTDGSALPESPRLLIMVCLRPAVEGGDSVLIDGYQVYQAIAGTDPQMLDALCARDSVHFGTGAGYLGSIFRPLPGGRIAVRFRFDDLARFSPTVGRRVDGFRRLLARYERRGRLHAGDGYVLLNDRWLHGCTGFRGDRLMLQVLGDPLSQHAIPTGFPADNPHVVAPGG